MAATPILLTELYRLAKRQSEIWASSMCWTLDLHPSSFPSLYPLATQFAGVTEMKDGEVLQTFFTDEAIETLLTMPNPYWFWNVVSEMSIPSVDPNQKLGIEALQRVIGRMRRAKQRVFNLNKDIDELTPDETACWVASGIILVRIKNNDIVTRVRHPIFARSTNG